MISSRPTTWLTASLGVCALAGLAILSSAPPSRSAPTTGPSAAAAALEPGGSVWWNERWCRLVGLEGAWSADTSEGTPRLRPDGEGCTVALVSVLSGQVVHYSMTEEGEVLFAHGWIMVSPDDRTTLPAPVEVEGSSIVCTEGRASRVFNRRFLERIVWHPGGQWRHEVAEDVAEHRFSLVADVVEEGPPASFDTISHAGEATTYTATEEGDLRVAQFQDEDGYSALCICVP